MCTFEPIEKHDGRYAARTWIKLDREKVHNIYKVCVVCWHTHHQRFPSWHLIGWDMSDFPSETPERMLRKLDTNQILISLFHVSFVQIPAGKYKLNHHWTSTLKRYSIPLKRINVDIWYCLNVEIWRFNVEIYLCFSKLYSTFFYQCCFSLGIRQKESLQPNSFICVGFAQAQERTTQIL